MFQKKLLNWYEEFGRKLPWRETNNPYYIWLSEIIMQQTRIEQGLAYYELFIKKYPTVKELADASEEDILKSWQGLGYYSRARNLHTAAQQIMDNYNGNFPDTYEGILALKGVGRYTAAAIASFAYGMDYPVIDGNVYRFISRFYGIYTPIGTEQAYKEFEKILMRLIDK
jgi:A/G-specific adenine glycosylase